jgi:hypothetical protein
MTKYHVQITEEEIDDAPASGIKGGVKYSNELFSLRVDEDPSKAIMRLLSAEKRGPRKGSKQAKQEAAK